MTRTNRMQRLVKARPNRWSTGRIHVLDPDAPRSCLGEWKTLCGMWENGGERMKGHAELVTCLRCRKKVGL